MRHKKKGEKEDQQLLTEKKNDHQLQFLNFPRKSLKYYRKINEKFTNLNLLTSY